MDVSRNLAVLVGKLEAYVKDFPQDDEWDSLCDQSLVEDDGLAVTQGDGFGNGFVAGVLAMICRNDPRFIKWQDEICTDILPPD